MKTPEEIAAVHEDYFDAGADWVITAGYQATFEGSMLGFAPIKLPTWGSQKRRFKRCRSQVSSAKSFDSWREKSSTSRPDSL